MMHNEPKKEEDPVKKGLPHFLCCQAVILCFSGPQRELCALFSGIKARL